MADILSQEEIDALLSATEGDVTPEKAESPADAEERRRAELRGAFIRKTDLKSILIRKYSDEEIEEMVEEKNREEQIESRRRELRESLVEFGNGNYRKQYTDEEIEAIIGEEFLSA